MDITVDAVDVTERQTDARGRLTLGADYADETVRVAVVEVVQDDGDDAEAQPAD
jgi:hypothetical protein